MDRCKHEFVGGAEGVKCSLCGLRLTREEYVEYLNGHHGKAVLMAETIPSMQPTEEIKAQKPKKTTKKK